MKFLTFTNIWISFAAVSQTALTYFLTGKPLNYFLLLFLFCSTLFTYIFLRILKLKSIPAELYSEQMFWVNRHLKWITLLMMFGIGGSITFFLFLSHHQQFIISLAGIIALGYNLPIAKSNITLRKIPFLKSFFIAGIWTVVTFLLPISHSEFKFPVSEFLVRFFFFYLLTIPFDIRDLKYDDEKMKTLPQVFGIKGAVFIGWVLLISCFCVAVDIYDQKQELMLTISYIITGILLLVSLKERKDLFYPLMIDGMMILQFLLMLIMSELN